MSIYYFLTHQIEVFKSYTLYTYTYTYNVYLV